MQPHESGRATALDEIFARELFGVKLGLGPMRAICAALDHPELAAPTLIVAGTNGKGSVTAFLAAALTSAGYRVGRYTSPHLRSVTERFEVEGRPLDLAAIEASAADVLAAERQATAAGLVTAPMTFFELTTATAFQAFRRAGIDVAVIEVGLGGRLDATNVVEPIAAVITTIDFDHMAQLGTTLSAIAREKAGVMRAGVPVVTGERKDEPLSVIRSCAEALGAPLTEAHRGARADWRLEPDGRTTLRVETTRAEYGPLTLSLRGAHQVENAIVAVRALEIAPLPRPVPRAAIVKGLTEARWPGRLDLRELGDGTSVLLDAAHNAAGVASLVRYLTETGLAPLPVVFGVMRDKTGGEMVRALAAVASRFVFTQADTPRARPATELADVAREAAVGVPFEVCPSPGGALHRAWTHAARVCVCGSIFLVGDVLQVIEPA